MKENYDNSEEDWFDGFDGHERIALWRATRNTSTKYIQNISKTSQKSVSGGGRMSTEQLIKYLKQRIWLLEDEEKEMEDARIAYAADMVVKEFKIILDMITRN